MHNLRRMAVALATISSFAWGGANAMPIAATLEDFTNGGGFFATVTIEDEAENAVLVTANVDDPNDDPATPVDELSEADILAIFFSLERDDQGNLNLDLDALRVTSVQDANGNTIQVEGKGQDKGTFSDFMPEVFTSLSGPENVSGGNPPFTYDFGVTVGINGASSNQAGANQIVSFTLDLNPHVPTPGSLSTASFGGEIGLRVTAIDSSVYNLGSSKLRGPVTGTPPFEPVPSPAPLALLGAGLVAMRLGRRGSRAPAAAS